MIFSLQHRLVLFTPPKCASNTIHDLLCQRSCKCVIGPQLDGGTDIHTTVLPWEVWNRLDEFTFAVSVRSPYTRAASLYGHYKLYWPAPHLPFVGFLERFVLAPRYGFFNATIASMIEPIESPLDGRRPIRVTRHVRVEALVEDLIALGFELPRELPRLHVSVHRGLEEFTMESKQLVDLWSRHDFERFGYATDIPRLR